MARIRNVGWLDFGVINTRNPVISVPNDEYVPLELSPDGSIDPLYLQIGMDSWTVNEGEIQEIATFGWGVDEEDVEASHPIDEFQLPIVVRDILRRLAKHLNSYELTYIWNGGPLIIIHVEIWDNLTIERPTMFITSLAQKMSKWAKEVPAEK